MGLEARHLIYDDDVTRVSLGREERYKEKPALAHVRGVRLMQQCTKAKKVLSSVAETVRSTQSPTEGYINQSSIGILFVRVMAL